MQIKKIVGEKILDSVERDTIKVNIETDYGRFSASSPSGTSIGKYEKKAFSDSVEESIEKLEQLQIKEHLNNFDDLIYVESGVAKKFKLINNFGANALLALELAVLKAIAFQKKKQLWQIINEEKPNKTPLLVGNCIGGGLHSPGKDESPDFQEFLFIPKADIKKSIEINQRAHKLAAKLLEQKDDGFKKETNYENAWQTTLPNNRILYVMQEIQEEIEKFLNIKLGIGIDVAASTFFAETYFYKNPEKKRNSEDQIRYINSLIEKFNLVYVEDALEENDFIGFSKLNKKAIIVGDDLTVTQIPRLQKAIKNNSINAVIVKPNQNGSLLQVKKFCELAKKNKILTIFSHRSGETLDSWLADLAYGFHADFLKCGITGTERLVKLKRLADIAKD